jgi:hypothetical protein
VKDFHAPSVVRQKQKNTRFGNRRSHLAIMQDTGELRVDPYSNGQGSRAMTEEEMPEKLENGKLVEFRQNSKFRNWKSNGWPNLSIKERSKNHEGTGQSFTRPENSKGRRDSPETRRYPQQEPTNTYPAVRAKRDS